MLREALVEITMPATEATTLRTLLDWYEAGGNGMHVITMLALAVVPWVVALGVAVVRERRRLLVQLGAVGGLLALFAVGIGARLANVESRQVDELLAALPHGDERRQVLREDGLRQAHIPLRFGGVVAGTYLFVGGLLFGLRAAFSSRRGHSP